MREVGSGGPSRTALFVERDSAPRVIRRRIVHSCTLEEWNSPAHRSAAIAECWGIAIKNMRADNETFMAPSPVTLYCDLAGRVKYADISLPNSNQPIWIDALGRNIFSPKIEALIPRRTTYMEWAEGPLPYRGDSPMDAPDPLLDRNLQYIRNQNSSLRAVIDSALVASRDSIARDVQWNGVIDFRVRGIFELPPLRAMESKQAGGDAKVILDGQTFTASELQGVA